MKRALITVHHIRGGSEELLLQAPLEIALPPPMYPAAPVTMDLYAYPNKDKWFDSILVAIHGKPGLLIHPGESVRVSVDVAEDGAP